MVLTRRGFTLIELLIVIGIIAILTVAFLPTALRAPAKARDAARVKAINDIAAAIESYQLSGRGPMRDGSTAGCFMLNTGGGVPALVASNFGDGRFPGDATVQSCVSLLTSTAGDNPLGRFPYYFRRIGTGGPYVLAARVEVDATANVFLTDGTTPWTALDVPTACGANVTSCQQFLTGNANTAVGRSVPYFMLIGQ